MSKQELKQEAKAEAKAEDGTVIQIDTTAIMEYFDKRMKELEERLVTTSKPKDMGKGLIEARLGANATKLIEEFKAIKDKNITEQWTIAIPNYTTKATRAHLRNFVWVTEVLKGNPGDTAYIPYVKDFDFQVLSAVGDAFSGETTGIINVLSTTLKEAGAWSDVTYADIEKIDANLLDLLNQTFTKAAVRAEDKVLVELLSACTSTNFAGSVDRKTGTAKFYASNIPKAIGLLLQAGKDISPGELVLYITGRPYAALVEELTASNAFTVAEPGAVTKGMIEQYLGVNIVIGGEIEAKNRTASASTGTMELAFCFRAQRCLALAPKRDILVETDRQIATRKLRITGSHTFGVKLLDAKECIRIWTSQATT